MCLGRNNQEYNHVWDGIIRNIINGAPIKCRKESSRAAGLRVDEEREEEGEGEEKEKEKEGEEGGGEDDDADDDDDEDDDEDDDDDDDDALCLSGDRDVAEL